MKRRYYIYIIFVVIYFLFWGLVPLEKDPFYALTGNDFRLDVIVRSSFTIMISAILGIFSIEIISLSCQKIKIPALRLVIGIIFGLLACFSFFLSGQNLEVSNNREYVKERLWFFSIRTIVIVNPDDNNDSLHIINNYSDEGCFRYYHYNNKEFIVFRGLGFAFNLTEAIH